MPGIMAPWPGDPMWEPGDMPYTGDWLTGLGDMPYAGDWLTGLGDMVWEGRCIPLGLKGLFSSWDSKLNVNCSSKAFRGKKQYGADLWSLKG